MTRISQSIEEWICRLAAGRMFVNLARDSNSRSNSAHPLDLGRPAGAGQHLAYRLGANPCP